MDRLATEIKLSGVDVSQRLISGYAAAHSNIDRVRDVIDPGASVKAVARLSKPSDVANFIGHASDALPTGIPQRIEATPLGLYTETYILKGPAGDNLLAVAKDLLDHGLTLGMSIGYKTHDSRMEQTARGRVRRILDYELKEYSWAAHQSIANPLAVAHSVKSRKALGEGSETAGGALVPADRKGAAMQYRLEKQGTKWAVLSDADADGDADDGRVIGTYDSQETATAVAVALRKAAGTGDTDDDDKTAPPPAQEVKAVWSAKYMDTLPDSSYLFIEAGGATDSENKTVPRSLRHFPYKNADGAVDLPHLRDAIGRIPQAEVKGLDSAGKAQLQARARRILSSAEDGKTYDEPVEWKTGSPITLWGLGAQLHELAERCASELKAMALLGEETKDNLRMRAGVRDEVRAIMTDLTRLVEHTERIDRGEDGAAHVAWLRAQLALTEV